MAEHTVQTWGVCSFELSADQLAEAFIRNTPACLSVSGNLTHIRWVGFSDRGYSCLLDETLTLPAFIARGHGKIGIFGFLSHVFRIHKACCWIRDAFLSKRIQGIVIVDFPAFHMRLVDKLKAKLPELKVIYVSPPKTWASRSRRLNWLKKKVSQLITVYDYEHRYFQSHGLHSTLLQSPWIEASGVQPDNRQPKHSDSRHADTTLVIYPGSRIQEIHTHLRVCEYAVDLLRERAHRLRVYVSIPETLWPYLGKKIHRRDDFHYFCGDKLPTQAPDVAWVCSGTMTAKGATWGIPMVILYALDWVSYLVLRKVYRYSSFLGIPNLFAQQEVYPELIGPHLTADKLYLAHLSVLARYKSDSTYYVQLSHMLRQSQLAGKSWPDGIGQTFERLMEAS